MPLALAPHLCRVLGCRTQVDPPGRAIGLPPAQDTASRQAESCHKRLCKVFLLPEDPSASSGFLKIAAKPGKHQDAWKAPSLQQTKTKTGSPRQTRPSHLTSQPSDGHVSAPGGVEMLQEGGGGGKEEDLGHWNCLS